MLLAIDIGNTNIAVGVFESDNLLTEVRLKTDQARTVDEYCATLFSVFERKLGSNIKFSGCIVSSVVPPLTDTICRVVKEGFGVESLVVGVGIKTGVSVKVDEPRAVGADRIVNSVAAKKLFGTPALVVDFGTATTFDYVSADGSYEGGIIAPGLNLSVNALVQNTSRLPKIELQWPEHVVGKNTVAAMQSGVMIGYLSLVEGLIDRIIGEKGEIKYIVTTGGLGRVLSAHSEKLKNYDPYLTLKGLRFIYELNR